MDLDIDKICRCCLQEQKSRMKNLLDPFNDSNSTFLDSYTLCSGIALPPDTSCKQICGTCEINLKISYDFRQLCQLSHQILQNIADTQIKAEVLSDNDDVDNMEIVYNEGNGRLIHQVFVHEIEQSRPKVKTEVQPAKEEKIVVGPDEESDGGHGADDTEMDYECDDEEDIADSKVKIEHAKVEVDADIKGKKKAADEKAATLKVTTEPEVMFSSYMLEGNFVCGICDAMLNTNRELNEHRKTHTWDLGQKNVKRVCGLCKKHTDNFLAHLRNEHPDHKPNKCRQCDTSFSQACQLRHHLIIHLEGKFPCKGCSKKFSSIKKLKTHIFQTKHSKTSYQCYECGQVFKLYLEFYNHYHVSHEEDKKPRKFFPCFGCKTIFLRRKIAHQHKCDPEQDATAKKKKKKPSWQSSNKPMTPFIAKLYEAKKEPLPLVDNCECDKCGEKFTSKDEMICHKHTWCTNAEEVFCKLCNIVFKRNSNLRSHNRNLHQERNIICDECGSNWSTEFTLKHHKTVTHAKVRAYNCDLCELTFKDSRGLIHHQLSHKKREVQCHHCKKKFRSLLSIKRHMTKHMTQTPATIKCDFCEKMFIRLCDKRNHQRTHTRSTVNCTLCSKVYTNKSGLNSHMESVHAGIRYMCNVCPGKYSTKERLYDHYFVHRGFRPYHCNVCPRQEYRKMRIVKHLKQHNVDYNLEIHGYVEQDPNIREIINGCIKKAGFVNGNTNRKEPKKVATSTSKAAQKTGDHLSVDTSAETLYQFPVQETFYN